jgi:hypothetical protein
MSTPRRRRQVLREFAGLHRQLTDWAGVRVSLMQHAVSHGTPDAVFPNNWFSTHAAREGGGAGASAERTMVLYPMKCPNRAAERRPDIIAALDKLQGYGRLVDLTGAEREEQQRSFEGTGGAEGGVGSGAGVRGREGAVVRRARAAGWGGGAGGQGTCQPGA